jgi:hypothetical protein
VTGLSPPSKMRRHQIAESASRLFGPEGPISDAD